MGPIQDPSTHFNGIPIATNDENNSDTEESENGESKGIGKKGPEFNIIPSNCMD